LPTLRLGGSYTQIAVWVFSHELLTVFWKLPRQCELAWERSWFCEHHNNAKLHHNN